MKVMVHVDLEGKFREIISSHVRANWPDAVIAEETKGSDKSAGHSAVLVVTSNPSASSATKDIAALKRKILVQNGSSIEGVLFEVDAKLGRLTRSDLAKMQRRPSDKSAVTRREFLFGLAGRPQRDTDAPVVLNDTCESKFGCSKCVDACPAPGALTIRNETVLVSSELCVRCGVCAGVCPVAAIQMPTFSEDGYRGLLSAIDNSSAPRKTLVITCDESSVAPEAWMDVEEVPGIGEVGIRQLALAVNSSLGALVVYCPDASCAGREHARRAIDQIRSIANPDDFLVSYLEGKQAAVQISQIHRSSRGRGKSFSPALSPWEDYVNSLASISKQNIDATGLGLTEMEVSDSCTLCSACVESCPHDALEIQQEELIFHTGECTGCGYCEKICPERSISLNEMSGMMRLLPKAVYRDQIVKCAKCNTPYVSAKMLKKVLETVQGNDSLLRLCPNCKQQEIYEKAFGATNA